MRASTAFVALFAAAVAAAPPAAPPAASPQPSTPVSQPPSGVTPTPMPSGSATCNILSCAVALGAAGLKCVEFAFGGSGQQCMQSVLQDVETMPPACADCLNALLLPNGMTPPSGQTPAPKA
jgi:hypothetical protein